MSDGLDGCFDGWPVDPLVAARVTQQVISVGAYDLLNCERKFQVAGHTRSVCFVNGMNCSEEEVVELTVVISDAAGDDMLVFVLCRSDDELYQRKNLLSYTCSGNVFWWLAQ